MRSRLQQESSDTLATRLDAPVSPGIRYGGLIGVMLAFLLLLAFYLTVAGAAHRADLARQHARLEVDRQAACSAFTHAVERSRCADRLAHHAAGAGAAVASEQPVNDLLSTAWRERHAVARRPHRTAGIY